MAAKRGKKVVTKSPSREIAQRALQEYDDVSETPAMSMADLIAGVKAAAEKKSTRGKTTKAKKEKVVKAIQKQDDKEYALTDKALKMADELEKQREKQTAAAPDLNKLKTENKAYLDFIAAWNKFETMMIQALQAPSSLPKMMMLDIIKQFRIVKNLYAKIPKTVAKEYADGLVYYERKVNALARLNTRQVGLQRAVRFLGDRVLQKNTQGVIGVMSTLRVAASLVGHKFAEVAGDATKRGAKTAYAAVAGQLQTKPGEDSKAVTAIRAVDRSLRNVGSAVYAVGQETWSWVTKKFGSLIGSLWKFIKSPFSGGGENLAQKLLGLAILIPTMFAPILKGIMSYMDETFGEHWIMDTVTNLWTKTKNFIIDGVKDLLGIETSKDPNVVAQTAHDKKFMTAEERKNLPANTKLQVITKANQVEGEGILAKKFGNYSKATGSSKQDYRDNLQNFIYMYSGMTISAGLYNQIKAAGLDVSSLRVSSAGETTMPVITAGSSTAGGGRGSAASYGVVDSVGGGRGSVNPAMVTSSPMQAPMDGPAVTSTPPRASESSVTSPPKGQQKGGSQAAASVMQTPSHMADDHLVVHNAAMSMGG